MKHILPFSGNRFELEGEHSYFLQADSFGRLQTETPKPVYLTGPRGTGKTTLLKAFDLNERRLNASLRSQLGNDPFASPAGPFIGVYFRVPDTQLSLIERWQEGESEEEVGKVLAFYMDLQWLQELTRLMSSLLADGLLTATPLEERTVVGAVVAEFQRTFSDDRRAPQTVAELRTSLKRITADFDAAARRRAPWRDVLGNCDAIRQPGTFGRFVATELANLCKREQRDGRPWHFRVCIDEADVLSDLQLRSLNSIVRLCKWPVFPVAAFGGVARDYTSTSIPHLSIQDADCDVIDLSEFLTARRFRELAVGVANVRVASLTKDTIPVDLDLILGTLGVNGLLSRILAESVSPYAKDLLARARALQSEPFFKDVDQAEEAAPDEAYAEACEDELPIYQAFLVDRLHIELPVPDQAAWRRRRQDSAELRKKMVAAYLSICSELHTQVRYASARIVLRLSDLCIRDFLKFMNSLHRASGLPVQDFVVQEMHWRVQHDALVSASVEKSHAIKGQDLRAPRETEAVVNGLAKLTHLLQTKGADEAHLRTSERGIFFLPIERWLSRTDRAAQTLREACDTGFLRFLSEDESHVSFRVHTSLAPAFQFSYRGAYYPAPLAWNDIERLSITRKDNELDSLAETIASRISRTENLSLFDKK